MRYLLVILIGYLLGCSSMSFYLSKLNGIDLQKMGSKNLGASNTLIALGWKAGISVALHDICKSILAVLLASFLFSELPYAGAVAGVASVFGHIFPFYLHFKGGKGFASYLGMTIALNWRLALAIILLVVLITLITDYIVLGTFTTIILVPLCLSILTQSLILGCILCLATLIIFYKHRENITRLRTGTEIGLRSAHRGDHRQK